MNKYTVKVYDDDDKLVYAFSVSANDDTAAENAAAIEIGELEKPFSYWTLRFDRVVSEGVEIEIEDGHFKNYTFTIYDDHDGVLYEVPILATDREHAQSQANEQIETLTFPWASWTLRLDVLGAQKEPPECEAEASRLRLKLIEILDEQINWGYHPRDEKERDRRALRRELMREQTEFEAKYY